MKDRQNNFSGLLSIGSQLAVASALGSILALAITTILARSIGPNNYGIYATYSELFILLVLPAQFGLPQYLVKVTSSNVDTEKYAETRVAWQNAWRINLTFSAFVMVGLIAYNTIAHSEFILWGLLIIPITSATGIVSGALRGLNHVVLGKLADMFLVQLIFLGLILFWRYLFPNDKIGISNVFLCFAFSQAITLAICAFILKIFQPIQLAKAHQINENLTNWRENFPFFAIEAIAVATKRIPVVLVAAFVLPAETGNLKIALQLAGLAEYGLRISNPLLSPEIAKLYNRGDKVQLQKLATNSTRAIIAINLVIISAFLLVGKNLVNLLLGPGYEQAFPILMILLIGQLINSITGAVESFMMMTGLEKNTARIRALVLCFLVISISIGAKFWGAYGAAISISLSMVTWNLFLWWNLRRNHGIDTMPMLRAQAIQ